MIKYKQIERPDDPDLIDFINYVFSQSHCPHDFIRILPKVYEPGTKHEVVHLTAQEDGRIRAVVSVLIFDMRCQAETLKVGYIGNVSVHPYHRGQGYMKVLMKQARDVMVRRGCDLAALGGQRQRYEYFGYYQGGLQVVFRIYDTNLRHVLGQNYKSTLQCGQDYDPEELYSIYSKQKVTGRSRETFEADCRTWDSELIALRQGDRTVGYVISSRGHDEWREAVLEDGMYAAALAAFMERYGSTKVQVVKPLYEQGAIQELARFAEWQYLEPSCMIQCLNWEKLLRWCLTLQDAEDGEGQIGPYHIKVTQGRITIEKTSEEPMPSTEVLFSPLPVEARRAYPRRWLPLRFWIGEVDAF